MIRKFPPGAVQEVGEGAAALWQVDLSRGKPLDLWEPRYSAAFLALGGDQWSDRRCIASFGLLNSEGTQPVAEYGEQRERLRDLVGSMVKEQLLPSQWVPGDAHRTATWFGQQLESLLSATPVRWDQATRRMRLTHEGPLYEQLAVQAAEYAEAPTPPATCAYCGIPYLPRKEGQSFCSPSCRTMAARKRVGK